MSFFISRGLSEKDGSPFVTMIKEDLNGPVSTYHISTNTPTNISFSVRLLCTCAYVVRRGHTIMWKL